MYNNAYGYNPYVQQNRYMPQQNPQPLEQQSVGFNTMQQRPSLSGKQVDSIDMVKAIEYPLDGSTSYFPLTDGSAIVTKQLQMDGTSKVVVYKPIDKVEDKPSYVTVDDLNDAIGKIDLSEIDDLRDEMKDIRQELKDLKKKKRDE